MSLYTHSELQAEAPAISPYGTPSVLPIANEAVSTEASIRTFRSTSEIQEIRSIWTAWQHHPNSDLDFFQVILRSRPVILRPHVIVLYRGQRPHAMLIGRIEEKKVGFKIGYGTPFKVRARLLTFIYAGLLGRPSTEDCEVMVREILTSLRQGEADAALLANLNVDSPLFRCATRVPGFWARDLLPVPQTHWSMTLPASVDELYRRMPEHHRAEIRRKAKKLVSTYKGRVTISSFRDRGEVDRMVRDVEDVARKTYQRGLGVGFSDNEEMRQRLRLDAQIGRLRGYLLYIAEQPCAFWIGSQYGETFHGEYVGYDPAYGKHSPGMFLTMRVIDELCRSNGGEKVREIDFGFGDAPYKNLLADRKWQEASVYIFGPTLTGVGLNLLRRPAIAVDRIARGVLERTNLLARVKKLWRQRARQKQSAG
jgi:hypothetical protein